LIQDEIKQLIDVSRAPNKSIREVELIPEIKNSGEQTGKFFINMIFELDTFGAKEERNEKIADTGRDCLNDFIDLIVFLTTRNVRLHRIIRIVKIHPREMKGEKELKEAIFFPAKYAEVKQSVKFPSEYFSNLEFEPMESKVLGWIRRGVNAHDSLTRFISFCTALDIISTFYPPKTDFYYNCPFCKNEIKECPHCKERIKKNIGIRECVDSLVIDILKRPTPLSKDIWDNRNAIIHGKEKITAKISREIESTKF